MTMAFGLVIFGGLLAALFIVPTTTTPRWKWENIWGLGSLVGLVAVPWPLAWATAPHLGDVYPMFLGAMIVTGNLVGILRGEWRGTSAFTRMVMVAGILVLAAAFLLLGQANHWLGS